MTDDRQGMDQLARLVGYCGLTTVFPRIAAWAGVSPTALERSGPSTAMRIDAPARGLSLELEYVLREKGKRLPDGWALREIVVHTPGRPAPYGLDAESETPASARRKLSDDTVGGRTVDLRKGDYRISHFLDDGRVIEVRFRPSLVGYDRLWIVRIGEPIDLRGSAAAASVPPGSCAS